MTPPPHRIFIFFMGHRGGGTFSNRANIFRKGVIIVRKKKQLKIQL